MAVAPRRFDSPEEEALHELQLGIEYIYRGFGALLAAHHHVGRGMNRFYNVEALLREAGYEGYADDARDRLLPAGAVGDMWTYELVDDFREHFLADLVAFETAVRVDLAGGEPHTSERKQQRDWRERAEGDDWKASE